jgi:hypothetical protein
MKTNNHISNLKKAVITLAAALVFSTGIQASDIRNSEATAEARLAVLMEQAEMQVRFVAPDVNEDFESVVAIDELDAMTAQMQETVQYVAPEADQDEFVSAEMNNLENLTSEMEAEVKYVAPAADFTEAAQAENQLSIETLANVTK